MGSNHPMKRTLATLVACLVVTGVGVLTCRARRTELDRIAWRLRRASPVVMDPRATSIGPGSTEDQITALLGKPVSVQRLRGGYPIFGPIDLARLGTQATVRVWYDPASAGQFSVYFDNDSNTAWHTCWVRKGVVF